VFDDVVRPVGLEEIFEGAGALREAERAIVDGVEKPAGEFEVFTRLVDAEALHEPDALLACRHPMSVPPSAMVGSHADGASVMLP